MQADVFPVYLADLLDITADDPTLLVAVEDGAVVGTARLLLRPTSIGLPAGAAYVRGVAVRPDRLGTGVARALMASCTGRARAVGADSMWLHTAAFMRPAIRLYEGLGYRRVPAYDTDSRRHYGLPSDPPLHAFAYRLDLATFVEWATATGSGCRRRAPPTGRHSCWSWAPTRATWGGPTSWSSAWRSTTAWSATTTATPVGPPVPSPSGPT
jgi:GNAT superfamily N-acetyltransferase